MVNSTKIEDVVEVRIELGKTFVREKFVFLDDSFFLLNQRSGWVGVKINDKLKLKLKQSLAIIILGATLPNHIPASRFWFRKTKTYSSQLNLSRDSEENRIE